MDGMYKLLGLGQLGALIFLMVLRQHAKVQDVQPKGILLRNFNTSLLVPTPYQNQFEIQS